MGNTLEDHISMTIGIPDYIPAIHDQYFTDDGNKQPLTAAESLIYSLENINSQVNYPDCNRFFKF